MPASKSLKALLYAVTLASLGVHSTSRAQERGTDDAIHSLRAEAEYLRARLTRVDAEMTVAAYAKESLGPELATARGEATLAESDLSRAADRVAWSRRMHEKGFVSKATQLSDQLTLDHVARVAEAARARRDALEKSIAAKVPERLRGEVDKARSAETEKRAAYDRARNGRVD